MNKQLEDLSKEEFYKLKASGMLWEFYPDAPEFYEGIRRMKCNGKKCSQPTKNKRLY